jgi:hypothetical protein
LSAINRPTPRRWIGCRRWHKSNTRRARCRAAAAGWARSCCAGRRPSAASGGAVPFDRRLLTALRSQDLEVCLTGLPLTCTRTWPIPLTQQIKSKARSWPP